MNPRKPSAPQARPIALPSLNGSKEMFRDKLQQAPNPRYSLPPTLANGPSAPSHDVMAGPAPMHTTNAFHPNSAATPQIGLNLGFNK